MSNLKLESRFTDRGTCLAMSLYFQQMEDRRSDDASALNKFRCMQRSLHFASVLSSVCNRVERESFRSSRYSFEVARTAARAGWRDVGTA